MLHPYFGYCKSCCIFKKSTTFIILTYFIEKRIWQMGHGGIKKCSFEYVAHFTSGSRLSSTSHIASCPCPMPLHRRSPGHIGHSLLGQQEQQLFLQEVYLQSLYLQEPVQVQNPRVSEPLGSISIRVEAGSPKVEVKKHLCWCNMWSQSPHS